MERFKRGEKYEVFENIQTGGGAMLNERKKIITLIQLIPAGGVITIALMLILISIFGINNYFNEEIVKKEKEIEYQTVYEAKKEVKAIYGLVESTDYTIKKSFKREIKIAVDLGYTYIERIYKRNKYLPKEVVIQQIKDNLRDVRFYNDKSGYYFIYDMNGKLLLLPPKPELEGQNLLNHKDIKGKYIIKEFIEGLKEHKILFKEWYYYKPNTNKIEKKLGYAKKFTPLNIFIGSAVYFDNIQKELNKKIVKVISRLNVVNGSDILLLNSNLDVIYSKDRKLFRTKLLKYKQILEKNLDNVGVEKIDNELIVYYYYEPLKILILNKINLEELKKSILEQKDNTEKVIVLVVEQFLIVSFIFIILVLLVTFYLTNLIKRIFDKYEKDLIKEKEKAQEAAKIKSEFLANMSHEIRTPLNAMFGFIKILQEKDCDTESKKYLNIVQKSGENLLTIINDILDFSKIEAGKFQIERISFNPKEEIEVIHELFASKASEKNILLEINETLTHSIVSDPTRIKQVIANLLSNAIKFTQNNKKIILNVKYDENREKLFVEVIDEGIGIPKEKLNTIFESFSQADNSTTRKYGGTGLGLTISYKLVELLGGELKVESVENKGSRFYFEIPAKKGKLVTEIKKEQIEIDDEEFNYHILVVEDNIANQMFMKVILKKMGVTFDIANNGLEAIEKFKQNKYDLILMDENMPKMDGIEATKIIRDIERELYLEHTIITALTANALEGDKERFILAGMDFYLSKPLDVEKLKQVFMRLKTERIKK